MKRWEFKVFSLLRMLRCFFSSPPPDNLSVWNISMWCLVWQKHRTQIPKQNPLEFPTSTIVVRMICTGHVDLLQNGCQENNSHVFTWTHFSFVWSHLNGPNISLLRVLFSAYYIAIVHPAVICKLRVVTSHLRCASWLLSHHPPLLKVT